MSFNGRFAVNNDLNRKAVPVRRILRSISNKTYLKTSLN
jgi:hypothetical protein